MGKTSFKTHDPFVVLEHLDGKLPLHIASLILCSVRHVMSLRLDHTRTGYEDAIVQLMFVHSICIFCQVVNRYQFTQEADVVQQQITKHINRDDIKKDLQDSVRGRLAQFFKEKATKAVRDKLSESIEKAKALITGRKPKQDIQHQKLVRESTKVPTEDLYRYHFQLKSFLTIIGGGLYQFQIYSLIVMLFYRTSMVKTGDGQPAVLLDNSEGQLMSQRNVTEDGITKSVYTEAGYFVVWEVALFVILIIDYTCQMFAIMLIQLSNFVIDLGRPTSTDRISESKYYFKPFTFYMTSIVSNIMTTYLIKTQSQMRVLPVNNISYVLDIMIMFAYFSLLAAAHHFNIMKKGPFEISYLIQKRRFQFIIYSMLTLTMARCLILSFGTLIQMAYHDDVDTAKESLTSYTLNQFQALQMLFGIPYLLTDLKVAQIESKLKQRIKLQQDPFYKKLEDPKKLKKLLKDIEDPESKNWQAEYKNQMPNKLRILTNKSFHQNETYQNATAEEILKAVSQLKNKALESNDPDPINEALCTRYKRNVTHQLKSYFRIKFILSYIRNYTTIDRVESLIANDSEQGYAIKKSETLSKRMIETQIISPKKYRFATVINSYLTLNQDIIKESRLMKWKWPRLILISKEGSNQIAFQREVDKIVDQLYLKDLPRNANGEPDDEKVKEAIQEIRKFHNKNAIGLKEIRKLYDKDAIGEPDDRFLDEQYSRSFIKNVFERLGISQEPKYQCEYLKLDDEAILTLVKELHDKMMKEKKLDFNPQILEIFHRDMENQKLSYKCLKRGCSAEQEIDKEFVYVLSQKLGEKPCKNCRKQAEIDDERKLMRDMRTARKELFNCLLQEKAVLDKDVLFKNITKYLKRQILDQYKLINEDIDVEAKDFDDPGDAHISTKELLRIHHYFEKKQIDGVLDQIAGLIGTGENNKQESLRVQQMRVTDRIQAQMKKILNAINFNQKDAQDQQKLIKSLQNRFEFGITAHLGKNVAKRKYEILKACSKIDKELKNLENISVYDSDTREKLVYPIKFIAKSKAFLAEYLRQRLEYEKTQASQQILDQRQGQNVQDNNQNQEMNEEAREKTTQQISKESHFELEMQDLASVLIKIDEEFNTIKGKKKRVETLFDFYHMKSSNLAEQYKNVVYSVQAKNRIDKIKKKEESSEVEGVGGITMHNLKFDDFKLFEKLDKEQKWFEVTPITYYLDENRIPTEAENYKKQVEVPIYNFKHHVVCEDCQCVEEEKQQDNEEAKIAEDFNDALAEFIDQDEQSHEDKTVGKQNDEEKGTLSPYDFSFRCDYYYDNDSKLVRLSDNTISQGHSSDGEKLKQRGFYCGQCGIDRVKQKYENSNPKYLILEEDIYSYQYLSMLNKYENKSEKEDEIVETQTQSLCTLPEQTDLFFKSQMIFAIQASIICILFKQNLIDYNGGEYQKAYPTLIFIQMLTAYLFHVQTLNGAKFSYQRAQFLNRYPERFNAKYIRAARIVCYQQFLLNIFCELLNLGLLCQQEGFQDLILNYVAYAGILEIDNVYMATQKAKYKDLGAIIEKPEDSNHLQLFKSSKFQHVYRASKVGSFFLSIGRFTYKWIYFYLLPMLVVPVGIFGWQGKNLNTKWRDDPDVSVYNSWWPKRSYPDVDFTKGQDIVKKSVFSDDFMILFMLVMFTIFTMIIYAVFKIGDMEESRRQARQNKIGVFLYLCLMPFIYWVILFLLQFTWQTIDILHNIGYYFGWVDFFNLKEQFVEGDDDKIKSDAPLLKANIYLAISFGYYFLQAKQTGIKSIVELFSFIFNVLVLPIFLYCALEVFFYEMTIQPYKMLWIGVSQDKCITDEGSNSWLQDPEGVDPTGKQDSTGKLDCHGYVQTICKQFYFVAGFLIAKHYIIGNVFNNIKEKMAFSLDRAYKNDDDFPQKVPLNKVEAQIFMGVNFFRKYPKNIVQLALVTGILDEQDGDKIQKARDLFLDAKKTDDHELVEHVEHKNKEKEKETFSGKMDPLDLLPIASSACRKLIKLQELVKNQEENQGIQDKEKVKELNEAKEALTDINTKKQFVKDMYCEIKIAYDSGIPTKPPSPSQTVTTKTSPQEDQPETKQKKVDDKEKINTFKNLQENLIIHIIPIENSKYTGQNNGSKGQFILDQLIKNEENIAETIFHEYIIEMGVACDEKQIIMLFVKDDDKVEKKEAEIYDVEQDMPFFVLFVLNFLTLVFSIVIMEVGYRIINKFLYDIVFINFSGFICRLVTQIYVFQVRRAKWGKFTNVYLFIEIYALILLVGYSFVVIFQKQFFHKAMIGWTMSEEKILKFIRLPKLQTQNMLGKDPDEKLKKAEERMKQRLHFAKQINIKETIDLKEATQFMSKDEIRKLRKSKRKQGNDKVYQQFVIKEKVDFEKIRLELDNNDLRERFRAAEKHRGQLESYKFQVLVIMLLIPFQTYLVHNFGLYEMQKFFYEIKDVKNALNNEDVLIALSNPLLVLFGIASVPYILIGSIVSFLNDTTFQTLHDIFEISWESFSFDNSPDQQLPFQDNWLPYFQIYLVLVPFAFKFYKKSKIKKWVDELLDIDDSHPDQLKSLNAQSKIQMQRTMERTVIVVSTVFSAYIMINWFLFLFVGHTFRMVYKETTQKAKYSFAFIFICLACYFLNKYLDSGSDSEENDKDSNEEDDEEPVQQPIQAAPQPELTEEQKKEQQKKERLQKHEETKNLYFMTVFVFIACLFIGSARQDSDNSTQSRISVQLCCVFFLSFVAAWFVLMKVPSEKKISYALSGCIFVLIMMKPLESAVKCYGNKINIDNGSNHQIQILKDWDITCSPYTASFEKSIV